jgi:chromosome segregation ATPase
MSELNTHKLDSKRPFEERVFARFDALESAMRQTDARLGNIDPRLAAVDSRLENIDTRLNNVASRLETVDSRIGNVDSRLQKLEVRAYDTKPIWEQALKEIVDTRKEIVDARRELSKRLDRIEAITHETRADLRDAEDRIDKIERKPVQ